MTFTKKKLIPTIGHRKENQFNKFYYSEVSCPERQDRSNSSNTELSTSRQDLPKSTSERNRDEGRPDSEPNVDEQNNGIFSNNLNYYALRYYPQLRQFERVSRPPEQFDACLA